MPLAMSTPTTTLTLKVLTDDMISEIDAELAEIASNGRGFGEVTLVMEQGILKWIRPCVSKRIGFGRIVKFKTGPLGPPGTA